jgi:hypothetical protein
MTDEQFKAELDAIGEKYIGAISNEVTKLRFTADIMELVERFYQQGGLLSDIRGHALRRDEVDIVIGMGPHKISAQAVRRIA